MAAVKSSSLLLLFFVLFAVIAPTIRANIAEYDDYWKEREEEAKKAALEAFHPTPQEVNDHFNLHVEDELTGSNGTRRSLRVNKGPCKATNPIDRCWRCRPNWASQRKRLADCVLGFGRNTVGGKYGKYYFVTDPSDNDMVNPKKGTLRHAVIQPRPLWIVFARSMIIRLNQELIMTSDKTIDGRGVNVHIAYGAGITIQFVKNVIIHGLHIHDIVSGSGGLIRDSVDHFGYRSRSDGDGISIYGSSHVWIDHNSMSNCKDGLIDAIQGSTAITISNNHFTKHNEVTKRDYAMESEWKKWTWRSEGDLMRNGAFFVPSGNPSKRMPYSRLDMIKAKPGTYVSRLTRFSGALTCRRGGPC
uniref:Pectate lyase n=1 Tax=Vitis vinifera TaxID=29760 RepID=A5BAB2_VITVI|nr:hypothetical protein VITISV_001007 [Vitis vinifera]